MTTTALGEPGWVRETREFATRDLGAAVWVSGLVTAVTHAADDDLGTLLVARSAFEKALTEREAELARQRAAQAAQLERDRLRLEANARAERERAREQDRVRAAAELARREERNQAASAGVNRFFAAIGNGLGGIFAGAFGGAVFALMFWISGYWDGFFGPLIQLFGLSVDAWILIPIGAVVGFVGFFYDGISST